MFGCFVVSDKFLKILYQIIQLSHLNVVLDDIAGVQKVDCLHILLDRFVILFLLEQFVCMLLDYLTLDVLWEASFFSYRQRFCVMGLLHEVINFDIVIHGV